MQGTASKYLYKHGLPFSKEVAYNLDDLRDRVMKYNKASMIIITGQVGEGKTTLAVECADYLKGAYERQGDVWVYHPEKVADLEHQLGMGGEAFITKIQECYARKLHECIYDEGGDFNKRGALTRFNQMMNRVFETYRAFKVVVIVTLPNFGDLDHSLIDKGIPRLLLDCHSRGERYGNFRAYNTYRMNYINHWMKKLVVKRKAFGLVHPNFVGRFLDLPPDRRTELEHLTIKGKIGILELAELAGQDLVDIKTLAARSGRSYVWTVKKLKELNISHNKVHKNKKYFHKDVVEVLIRELGGGGRG